MGGVLAATLLHPVNFVYGAAAGAVFGGVKLSMEYRLFPRGM